MYDTVEGGGTSSTVSTCERESASGGHVPLEAGPPREFVQREEPVSLPFVDRWSANIAMTALYVSELHVL